VIDLARVSSRHLVYGGTQPAGLLDADGYTERQGAPRRGLPLCRHDGWTGLPTAICCAGHIYEKPCCTRPPPRRSAEKVAVLCLALNNFKGSTIRLATGIGDKLLAAAPSGGLGSTRARKIPCPSSNFRRIRECPGGGRRAPRMPCWLAQDGVESVGEPDLLDGHFLVHRRPSIGMRDGARRR